MKLQLLILAIALGAHIAIAIYSNWQTSLAIFIAMWMNNISQEVE